MKPVKIIHDDQINLFQKNELMNRIASAMIEEKLSETTIVDYNTLINSLEKFSMTLPWRTRQKALDCLKHFKEIEFRQKIEILELIKEDVFSDQDLGEYWADQYKGLINQLHDRFGLSKPDYLEVDHKWLVECVQDIRKVASSL